MNDLMTRLREFDERRPGFPGEHLLVATLGASLLRSISRRRSGLGRVLALLAGAALLYRAASGRDGLARFQRDR